MGSEGYSLKMLFFPFMAQGHMLPMVDMAKLFASRGVTSTIVTTPVNAASIQPSVDRFNASCHSPISLHRIPFPSVEVGLPKGCENVSTLTSSESKNRFVSATKMLKEPFARALKQHEPDCVVTDMFFPWTYDIATELGIPRIVFHGVSLFALCVRDSFNRYKPLETLPADAESFVIPGIPHKIEILKSQVAKFKDSEYEMIETVNQMKEREAKNYGVIVNSFYELEQDYADHYRNVVGRKAWLVGPLSLCNNEMIDQSGRGSTNSVNQQVCIRWLDSKKPGSVIYVCFGSMANFSMEQLGEIALGLETSNRSFIWVVRTDNDDWIPQGFIERNKENGLIINGWAPQILILNHAAVGAFLTHCGWNSSLEGISAGLPLVTWPLFAEQFDNEKLIVEVLKIGVAVGAKEYGMTMEGVKVIEGAKVTKAIEEIMEDGEEANARRDRARKLGEAAKKAVEKGGSSDTEMCNLIQELKDRRIIPRQSFNISNQ